MKKINYYDHGYVRVSAVSPALSLANPLENAKKTLELFKQEVAKGSFIVAFPELGLTGYTCEDLFHTQDLLDQTQAALHQLISGSIGLDGIMVVGLPFQAFDGKLYNCGAFIHQGKLLALIPKIFRPNYGEFYEKRYFSSGYEVNQEETVMGQKVVLSPSQLIHFNDKLILGCEICEDAWAALTPSTNLILNGANVIVNLSASNELVGKSVYRKELITGHSARFNCAYIYASAGSLESTKDVVFGGHCLIAENGSLLAESDRFNFSDTVISTNIDLNKTLMERRKNSTFGSAKPLSPVTRLKIEFPYVLTKLERTYSQTPFIPGSNQLLERSEEILQIQATGLARRLLSVKKPKIVLGLSGGLDSTLALLVALEAIKKTNQPISDIYCYSMPGFGTSDRTKNQAKILAQCSGVNFEEIDITQTVLNHFKDINHDPQKTDFVYENAQARERTQILFDKANQVGGIVEGTSDLSEIFLGYCSLLGDHSSHYSVNTSVPKTLIKHLIKYYIDNKTNNQLFKDVLEAVLETTISPELLPTDKQGNIQQSTEDIVGPYILHDFFIFHYLRNGFSQQKIQALAELSFKDTYSPEVIEKWRISSFKRFTANQFKRTVSMAGPKIGSVSLSSRGDWRMPDEGS